MSQVMSRLERLEAFASATPAHRGTLVIPCTSDEDEKVALRRWGINPTEWSNVKFGRRPPGHKVECGPVFVPYGPETTSRERLAASLSEALDRAYGDKGDKHRQNADPGSKGV